MSFLRRLTTSILDEYNTAFDEGQQAIAKQTAATVEAKNELRKQQRTLLGDIVKTMMESDVPYVDKNGRTFAEFIQDEGGIAQFFELMPEASLNQLMLFNKQDKKGKPIEDPNLKNMQNIIQNINDKIAGKDVDRYILTDPQQVGLSGTGPQNTMPLTFQRFLKGDWYTKALEDGRYNDIANMALKFQAVNAEDKENKNDPAKKERVLFEFPNGENLRYYLNPDKKDAADLYNHLADIKTNLITNKDNLAKLSVEDYNKIIGKINGVFAQFQGQYKIKLTDKNFQGQDIRFDDMATMLRDVGMEEFAKVFDSFDRGALAAYKEKKIKEQNPDLKNKNIDGNDIATSVNKDGLKTYQYITPEVNQKFAFVTNALGYANVTELLEEGNNNYHDPDLEVMEMVDYIMRTPGFITQGSDGTFSNAYRGVSYHNVPVRLKNDLGLRLAVLDGTEEQKIDALRIAINDTGTSIAIDGSVIKEDRKVQQSVNYPVPQRIIDAIDKKTDSKGISELKAKVRLGEELQGLLIEFSTPLAKGLTYSGFAGAVDKFIVNVAGPSGQLDQLQALIQGGNVMGVDYNPIDIDDFEDSGLTYINKYIEKHGGKGFEYGKQAALRIFIAYKMAKYFDPSGRVSDRDLQNQLDAFAGTSLSAGTTTLGQATVALKRVNDELAILRSLNYDPSNVQQLDIRRLNAGSIYFGSVNTKAAMAAEAVRKFKYSNDQHEIRPHMVDGRQQTIDGSLVYQVFSTIPGVDENNNPEPIPIFASLGGIFVAQNSQGQYEPINIAKVKASSVSSVDPAQTGRRIVGLFGLKHNDKKVYEVREDGRSYFVLGDSKKQLTDLGDGITDLEIKDQTILDKIQQGS